ncbi:TonB-dependent receptor [uncultured Dokdonia sp.]|uniref:TonB-dependent receptor domain-containing protein n=1 Tax=uncultured Dokdonia sp. TaxID=575653 RepID=UPI00260E5718|nr:TonB-dependent receptor [uncultured Dokdonia sp.]
MKKVLLKSMLLFVAVLFAGISTAQTVSGTVTEDNGPLPGANVIVKGTQNGATTDFDGNYTLNNVASDAILVFSYVGYSTQEIAVGGRSTVNATLSLDNALDEVVLIGYGTTTVKDATGSVASVTSEEFNQGVIQSPEQLIQGKTAGVQISETSGEPGAAIVVNIRGNNSIRSGNNPLFVVDGVPLTSGAAPAVNVAGIGGGASRNPLSFLNPNDIESISILKDASATAIYGSRGANGVIIIQTKAGRGASKGIWDINTSVSVANTANEYDLLGRDAFLENIAEVGNDPVALDFGSDSDFQDFYTRTAYSRRTDLSYSKSYQGGNLRASFGYANTFGVVENTDQERIAGRLNITHKFLDDKLTLSGQFSIARVNDQFAPVSGGAGSTGDLIGASITQNPTAPIDPDFTPGGNVLNPVSLLENFLGRSRSNRFLGNLSATYAITEELDAKVTVGYDENNTTTTSAFGSDVIGLNGVSGIGRGNFNTFDQENSLLEATLSYNKEFSNSNLSVVGGYSYQEFARSGFFAQGAGFNSSNLDGTLGQLENQFGLIQGVTPGGIQTFGYGADGTFLSTFNPNDTENPFTTGQTLPSVNRLFSAYTGGNFDNTDELQSFFVRANYTIADKYLFTGTFRADGSTTFGENERYGYFPSGAFAWQLHEEDFIGDAFSTLKLRLGAGIVGNQEGLSFANFIQVERLAGAGIANDFTIIGNGNSIPGTFFQGDPNPDLKWEETTDFNVGVDFGFNNDRFNGTVNVYRKETRDLLLSRPPAAPATQPVIFGNLDDGLVLNQGVEVALNYDFFDTDDFGFSASFNVAFNKNEVQDTDLVIDLGPINGNGLTGAFAQRLQAGEPLGSFFLAEFTGFDGDGNPTYRDVNGDGVGDPDSDKTFVGESAIPEITSGLSLNARYKRFDLSTYFNGQFGFSVYNATDNAFFTRAGLLIGKNVTQAATNPAENPAATVAVSSRFLEAGDFVRLQSASLGYNWPVSEDGIFDSLRISLTGQNLFIITDYSGLDPEISVNTGTINASAIPGSGIDYAAFPRQRTFTLGVNARF